MGIDSIWVDSRYPEVPRPGDVVLAADVTSANLGYVHDVDYVLHNFDNDASPLCWALEPTPERLLRLQVWTRDATGEHWDTFRQFDREARTLFQPWGSDLLAEEFMPPVFNDHAPDVVFVGAVWSEKYEGMELGNEEVIAVLREECARRGLRFTHRTQIGQGAMVDAIRGARLAPAFAGAWQVAHGYLPCRYFKTAAYGQLAFGNVLEAEALLGHGALFSRVAARTSDFSVAPTIGAMLDEALALSEEEYTWAVLAQQEAIRYYTYRESIQAIQRALQEIKA